MNFLKGSLFRRNTEPEELEPMEESGGGILAVWGSPGCGKTVTAVKIAKHLAAQKKNTVLLLCDMTAPTVIVSIMRDSSPVIGGSAMAKSALLVLSFSIISSRLA